MALFGLLLLAGVVATPHYTSLTDMTARYRVAPAPQVTLRNGPITVVVSTRGLLSLAHERQTANLIADAGAGLRLDRIGDETADAPRRLDSAQLRLLGSDTVEIY